MNNSDWKEVARLAHVGMTQAAIVRDGEKRRQAKREAELLKEASGRTLTLMRIVNPNITEMYSQSQEFRDLLEMVAKDCGVLVNFDPFICLQQEDSDYKFGISLHKARRPSLLHSKDTDQVKLCYLKLRDPERYLENEPYIRQCDLLTLLLVLTDRVNIIKLLTLIFNGQYEKRTLRELFTIPEWSAVKQAEEAKYALPAAVAA